LHAEIEESVRGCDVYVVQPTGPPVDRNLMEGCVATLARVAGSLKRS
jgi:phosphoribosylpyrophosphate synthetase